jgi:plasmid stabilization system protein ParE
VVLTKKNSKSTHEGKWVLTSAWDHASIIQAEKEMPQHNDGPEERENTIDELQQQIQSLVSPLYSFSPRQPLTEIHETLCSCTMDYQPAGRRSRSICVTVQVGF